MGKQPESITFSEKLKEKYSKRKNDSRYINKF